MPILTQQFPICGRLNGGMRQVENTDRLPKKCRLPSLYLDHRQIELRKRQGERDGGRAAAGTDVKKPAGFRANVPRRHQGLQQQSVYRFIQVVERGEIDLAVPAEEKVEEGGQPVGQRVGDGNIGPGGASQQTGTSVARTHSGSVSDLSPCRRAIEVSGNHGDCSRRHTRNSAGLTER